ncbi:MAG: four helix bundle protein [Candidatus Nealsonbacteria bacterium DGGOD1a]|jgi:conserved hypothetical protein TIGR02436|nr:MAG: four helix bundle protein [Candidatus Nealsonbacteria bacterium DGGOD1a]
MSNLKSEKSNNIRFRAYDFSIVVIELVKDFPQTKMYMIFMDQLLRSATSIGANVFEAKSSSSKKDFARFYEIALKSANETIYWLSLLKDSRLVETNKCAALVKEAEEICRMIGSSLLTMRNKR